MDGISPNGKTCHPKWAGSDSLSLLPVIFLRSPIDRSSGWNDRAGWNDRTAFLHPPVTASLEIGLDSPVTLWMNAGFGRNVPRKGRGKGGKGGVFSSVRTVHGCPTIPSSKKPVDNPLSKETWSFQGPAGSGKRMETPLVISGVPPCATHQFPHLSGTRLVTHQVEPSRPKVSRPCPCDRGATSMHVLWCPPG